MSTDKQAPVAENKPQGRFPKFTDQNKDWKVLVNDNKQGENDSKKIIYYRIAERTRKKIDITIKSKLRPTVVSRRIRELLDQNQHAFGIQGAGVTMFGGCYPLYANKDAETPDSYTQGYRFTLRIV